ncbi:unnamed protein product [Dovyalis caffra]|uniref:Uncharacterized protein n=1 Tax=Dovyalis caffra TaxID=77055 RepID=A0AAV1S5P7_9ROSI|nr:unnamed protein product [Dovyalis caffra]
MPTVVIGKASSCNATTGRVTVIYLLDARDLELGDWYLNASLFLPFEELNDLSLSRNGIVGCVENEGFQKLWKLDNLEILDLGGNNFNNTSTLISSLSGLLSLKSLYLNNVGLKGSINIHDLNRLRNLEVLDLRGNEIEGFKSYHGGEKLLTLNNLKYLGLGNNRFDNNILSSLKGLSSLNYPNIAYNE